MKRIKKMLIYAAIATVVVVVIYIELATWQECRITNSFFFCMRVLNK